MSEDFIQLYYWSLREVQLISVGNDICATGNLSENNKGLFTSGSYWHSSMDKYWGRADVTKLGWGGGLRGH